jgi:chemotaxis protein MotB
MNRRSLLLIPCAVLVLALSGCGTTRSSKKADDYQSEISRLKKQMDDLRQEKDAEIARIEAQRERDLERFQESKGMEISELEKAKKELADSLQSEISEYKAKLEMTERGLVITFLAEVFFAPGKDSISSNGKESLRKVAEVLNKEVVNSNIAVEGHTDSDPIKMSGWRSNWELSSARSLSVLHYMIDDCAVAPQRLSANGCGEYNPVVANDTPENKRQNRRVEIIILPEQLSKVKK